MALHPLVYLAWLSAWRYYLDPRRLSYRDGSWHLTLTLIMPFVMAWLAVFYLPVLFVVGLALAERHRPCNGSIARALLVLPVVWLVTFTVLSWDPFEISDWF